MFEDTEPGAKMRTPFSVMQAIVQDVPKELTEAHDRFEYFRQTWAYRPPEEDQTCWAELAEVVNMLTSYPAPLDTDWKIKIVAELTSQSEDAIRQQFGVKDK